MNDDKIEFKEIGFSFGVENWKVFDTYHNFTFAPVTIITGTNSSGKSSFVDLISFVNDNFKDKLPFDLPLRDKNSEVLNRDQSQKSLKFRFELFKLYGVKDEEIEDLSAYLEFEYVRNFSGIEEHLTLLNVRLFQGKTEVYSYTELDSFLDIDEIPGKGYIDLNKLMKVSSHALFFEKQRAQEVIGNIDRSNSFRDIKLKEEEIVNKINTIYNNPSLFKLRHSDPELDKAIGENMNDEIQVMEKDLIDAYLNGEFELDDSNRFLFSQIVHNNISKIKYGIPAPELSNLAGNLSFLNIFFKERLFLLKQEFNKRVQEKYSMDNYFIDYTELGTYLDEGFWGLIEQFKDRSLEVYDSILKVGIFKNQRERIYNIKNPQNYFASAVRKYREFCKDGVYGVEYEEIQKFIKKWLKKFEIGENLEVIDFENEYAKLSIVDFDGTKIDISDLGYGAGQVISLILLPLSFSPRSDAWSQFILGHTANQVVALEEPESNIHPNWQSLLIEMIFELQSQFRVNFIIETHSEYMIRKLQNLVVNKEVKAENFKIMYFKSNKQYALEQNKEKKKFYEISIDKNGLLTKPFGPGFFDEAGNLALDIIKNQPQFKN